MFNIFTGKKNKSNISNIAENSIEQANSSIGKKVDDVKEQKEEDDDKNEYIEVKLEDEEDDKDEEAVKKSEEQNSNNNQNNSNNTSNNVTTPANEAEQANIATSIDEFTDEDINPVNSSAEEISNDPAFKMPVEGEIVKHFGKDKLIYSETLKEWTTHLGIDIKADKTTVVKAAADGTVKSIKNDPRYGLTVVLEHSNGFTSVYSNLLTAEFVVVGENVKSGQTLGTVGTSATFEILDDPHLHFEILKDGVAIDPEMYIR
jgi:murein DD-endopeptidase MepM/ murein hydrolase activator NlpD